MICFEKTTCINFIKIKRMNLKPGSEVIKLFLFSTLLSMKFKLLINIEIIN